MKFTVKGKFTPQELRDLDMAMRELDGVWDIRRAPCDRSRCYATGPLALWPLLARSVRDLIDRLQAKVKQAQARRQRRQEVLKMERSLGVQIMLDDYLSCDPAEATDDVRKWAHEMAVKTIDVLKRKYRSHALLTIKETAGKLGVGGWIVQGLINRDEIWHGKTRIERSGQHYNVHQVDVDEVRLVLEERKKNPPRRGKVKK